MEKQLVLISHGRFCEELKKSTEMIMGPQSEIQTVPLLPEEGADDFRQKLAAVIADSQNPVVFADLLGGTPCNAASRLIMEGATFELYAGMNMPMVIGFLNRTLTGDPLDYEQFGKENIQHVNTLLTVVADFEED
ncbi:PTS sugar transporter subunit IIA [Enterococcus gallinarum]|uniref:PTS sugar transporter subunit IIA n=1 Tax=Enterococcus gallinarum TaxID=1353 RepID=UPI0018AA2D84|nr:PTS sugar transporter subunit IIA [Enterococcus gallinarum]MDT2715103.1 PTS sugar transporter subunit IIA [Enterococcus gallinarum]